MLLELLNCKLRTQKQQMSLVFSSQKCIKICSVTRCCITLTCLYPCGKANNVLLWAFSSAHPSEMGTETLPILALTRRVCRLLWQPCQKMRGEERRQNLTLLRQMQGVKDRNFKTWMCVHSQPDWTGLGVILQAEAEGRHFLCGGLQGGKRGTGKSDPF